MTHASSAATIPLSLVEIARAQRMAAEGVPKREIAAALSTTAGAVEAALEGKVVPCAELLSADPPPRRIALTPSEIQRIGRQAALGAPLAEIAEEFGISPGKADWAIQTYRRGVAQAEAHRRFSSPPVSSSPSGSSLAGPRREVQPPETEPTMRDLMRVPLRAKN